MGGGVDGVIVLCVEDRAESGLVPGHHFLFLSTTIFLVGNGIKCWLFVFLRLCLHFGGWVTRREKNNTQNIKVALSGRVDLALVLGSCCVADSFI